MNGTPPSLEEKVRHCGEEQEYRDQLSHSRHRNHSMIGPMTLARGARRVEMTSSDMVGG